MFCLCKYIHDQSSSIYFDVLQNYLNEDHPSGPEDGKEDPAKDKKDASCGNNDIESEKMQHHPKKRSRWQRFMCLPVRRSDVKARKKT